MVCPYCSNDMEPIELNGKVFCSNCGLTVKTLTEPTRLNPDAKIIGGYKPEKIIQIPVQPATNPFPSNTPAADPINMNPITDETREEFGFETKENANNDLAVEEIPEISNQIPISIPVYNEDEVDDKGGQTNSSSFKQAETVSDDSYNVPVKTEILGNPASENEIDSIVKTLSEAELASHKPLNNQDNIDQIKGIDTLAAGGILLDILSDDLIREEDSAEIKALEAAKKLVTKITPGNIDSKIETIGVQPVPATTNFAAEIVKDNNDIKELESKLENIIEPVTAVYDNDIKKYDPDALNSARVKIEHRSRQGHSTTPKTSEPQKVDTDETEIDRSGSLKVPKLESESTSLFINSVEADAGNNIEEKLTINTAVPNASVLKDNMQIDKELSSEQQKTTKNEDEIKETKKKNKKGFFASFTTKKKPAKGVTKAENNENVVGTDEDQTSKSTPEFSNDIPTLENNLNNQAATVSKEDTTDPIVISNSSTELPTKKDKGFLGLFKKRNNSKSGLESTKTKLDEINESPDDIKDVTPKSETEYVITADDKQIDSNLSEEYSPKLQDEIPMEAEETTKITPIIKVPKQNKSFWNKFKKEPKPGTEEKPAETKVAEALPPEQSPVAETEQPEEDIQTDNASNDKENKGVVENHVTADYFKKVLEVKKAQRKIAKKKDKKIASGKSLTAKKIVKISILTIIGAFIALVFSFIIYNNNKPEVKLERTLSTVDFTTKKPSYIPEGYNLKDTNYDVNTKIFELTYQFITDKTRKIVLTETIKPEPQKYIDDLLRTDFKDQEYTIKEVNGQEFTEIKKYNLIWYRAEMVFTIRATNTNMDNQLLYKMTESIK